MEPENGVRIAMTASSVCAQFLSENDGQTRLFSLGEADIMAISEGWTAVVMTAEEKEAKRLARVYAMPFSSVYPHYVTKAEKKDRTKAEVDEIIRWLTGYTPKRLQTQIDKGVDFETFFAKAPKMNTDRSLITGVVCGVRVEEIEEPLMQEIRYLDKLIDELAKGKAMDKILRTPS